MNGNELLDALKQALGTSTDAELRHKLGVTRVTLGNWRKTKHLTARQVGGLVRRACQTAESEAQREAVRPVVEFFPIESCDSKQGARWELFSDLTSNGKEHLYLAGLKKELRTHHGVYIFFDSRGRAIYVGKARRQSLWQEMNSAYNRPRGSVQRIKRVYHPSRNQEYRTSDEKSRQITDHVVPLSDLASYFSAYAVADGLVDDVESLLVRSFANDILNKKMERFGRHRTRTS